MSGMTTFLIAVSGVSLVCYWLMTRVQNRAAARRSSYDNTSVDSSYSGSSDGRSLFSWFGGDSSPSDSSSSSSDFGSSDSGGGGDGGGGDGGGGGD